MKTEDKRQKLQELKNSMKSLEDQITKEERNCQHEFDKPKYDPEEKIEYDYKYVGHGSDFYPEITGSHSVFVPRWSRRCTLCGKMEYTHSTRPVGSEPNFK
jgi:hypothetical protein